MKASSVFVLFIVFHSHLNSLSTFYFKQSGMKVNTLCHFGLGVEFPIGKNFSSEIYGRIYGFNSGSVAGNIFKSNFRLNFKYHLTQKQEPIIPWTWYILGGFNLRYKTFDGWVQQNSHEKSEMLMQMGVFGFGIRGKRVEAWFAGEVSLNTIINDTYYNRYNSGYIKSRVPYMPEYSVSGGFAVYIFQSKINKI